ncbi:nuclear protein [Kwoniella heveanensis CBS 569]|uniref:Nuclear protein n=1 Tax=Kwoniella heveanensis BCC8398 TaxID=1296120 RepID=A0A1B9GUT0_9TREE|nr:nuclear protein [Kwoniella heveanensis BCC8398]OCF42142.1 nuclear protein [Kwoniella heveanensis CBS 569]
MPSTVRPRSPEPNATNDNDKDQRLNKKPKAETTATALSSIQTPTPEQIREYREKYVQASPFQYAAVNGLLSDELLEGVVEESWRYGNRGEEGSHPGWGWEQKETDIYKIHQTPDLSSLDPEHLPEETLAALPLTTRLKNALYSQEFRDLVRQVTGCGPLSGKVKDLSAGLYTQGSHLLLHDDSISTRLISYILYLPTDGKFLKGWDPKWGGALELFPVVDGKEVGPPGVKRCGKVDVKWGQIIFFEVQPGRSYHSVEEVIVGDGRQRLGVSGWFHRPCEGEEGYVPLDKEKTLKELSSLAQITAAPNVPFTPYTAEPPAGLKPSDLAFLQKFLSPSYLTIPTLEKLSGQFAEASEIVLHNFLNPELAAKLKAETEGSDKRDYPNNLIPPQDLGEGDGWVIQGPSSKHRFLNLTGKSTATPTIQAVHEELFPSPAFRAWLAVVSSLAPVGYRTEARRFRKGLDYTLANGEPHDGEARLDVSLGATWWADVPAGSDEEDNLVENGGWECYLAAPDEGEDPAVYQSAHAKKAAKLEEEIDGEAGENGGESQPVEEILDGHEEEHKEVKVKQHKNHHHEEQPGVHPIEAATATYSNGSSSNLHPQVHAHSNGHTEKKKQDGGPSISIGGQELEFDPDQFSPSDFDSDSEGGDDDEDDGPLLTQPVSFNKLMIVLRDPGVMKFVKYLGAGAGGSRWDVNGEWEVGMLEVAEPVAGEGEGESMEVSEQA